MTLCSGIVVSGCRRLYQYHACHRQSSLTAGSLSGSTKLPLTICFLAIHLISQATVGLSAMEIKRHDGVSYPTAWLMHHRIMTAMAHARGPTPAVGHRAGGRRVPRWRRAGGKPGRGSENKVPFVAAVSLNGAGNPRTSR